MQPLLAEFAVVRIISNFSEICIENAFVYFLKVRFIYN